MVHGQQCKCDDCFDLKQMEKERHDELVTKEFEAKENITNKGWKDHWRSQMNADAEMYVTNNYKRIMQEVGCTESGAKYLARQQYIFSL